MTDRITIFLSVLFFSFHMMTGQSILVPYGSNWKYADQGYEPSAQGNETWVDSAYSDLLWSQGDAQLGYGDGDESTEIGDTIITAYFRKIFTVADTSVHGDIYLNLIYDDGAVVYVNGSEVWRVNMPRGEISYSTFASSGSSDNDMASTIITRSLVNGENIIAVEVHQRSAGSSDISFDCKLTAYPKGSTYLTRGPYLQKQSPTSIVVKWRTAHATESVINYGNHLDQLNLTASSGSPTIEHELEIVNLQAGEKYYYEIANNTQVLVPGSQDLYFRSAPLSGSRTPMEAWILGDCGTGNNNARAVRDAYYDFAGLGETDLILFLGDNAYSNGTDGEYQLALFEDMYEERLKNTVSWSCLGNHDGHSANSSDQSGPYYDIFTFPTQGECGGMLSGTEAYYSFDHGNVHFISLDSYESDRNVGGDMYLWCEADLQNSTSDWIVAFWHHPPYSKGSHDSDQEGALVDMRENFLPLLESYGVDLVLSGHSHSYERSYFINNHYGPSDSFKLATHAVGSNGGGDGQVASDGAYQKSGDQQEGAVYITGGSSGKKTAAALDHEAMYYAVAELGSCILTVHGGELSVKFLREDTSVEDHFTIEKELDCIVGTSCDDGDMCTREDSINALCQCVGSPIVAIPGALELNGDDSPLEDTYKATESIHLDGSVVVTGQTVVHLIAPQVIIDPLLDVNSNAQFSILSSGCE
ncbi:MAG: metallophosphoesterase family protein [Saprospiraceae bacterium]|nr:metallophosphoesterase family protein [Saprospiraceae bacterium]